MYRYQAGRQAGRQATFQMCSIVVSCNLGVGGRRLSHRVNRGCSMSASSRWRFYHFESFCCIITSAARAEWITDLRFHLLIIVAWSAFLNILARAIWPIGRGIPWGNHGGMPVVTSWHTLQIGLYIWSIGVSHEHQRNYAWALVLLSLHMHLEMGCVSKGWIQTWELDACVD